MRKIFTLFLFVAMCVFTLAPSPTQGQNPIGSRPDGKLVRKGSRAIPGSYIVVFNEWAAGPTGPASQAAEQAQVMSSIYGGRVNRTFQHAINGYAAEMSEAEALALSQDPRVAYVEE
ncbi:MAG TPA: protease inhibitor I9 family protein, partial [Pyrinomonadaceae bacterium]|nr:protease inhibitor I9 family protein [Pyrinomonadaceae bacterium]